MFGQYLLNHNENLQIENYNTQVVKFILHQIIIDFCTGNDSSLRIPIISKLKAHQTISIMHRGFANQLLFKMLINDIEFHYQQQKLIQKIISH